MASQAPLTVSYINNIQLAGEEEQKGDIQKAIEYYEAAIQDGRADEYPYDRLMVLYRKEKNYKHELRVINLGLKVFATFYKKSTAKTGHGKKLSALSEAFMKSAGLKDKNGELVYQPEPIGKWSKRKEVVERKLEGGRTNGKQKTKNRNDKKQKSPSTSSSKSYDVSKSVKATKSKKKIKSKK